MSGYSADEVKIQIRECSFNVEAGKPSENVNCLTERGILYFFFGEEETLREMHQVGEYEESNSINGSSLIISCCFRPVPPRIELGITFTSGRYLPQADRTYYLVQRKQQKRVMKTPT